MLHATYTFTLTLIVGFFSSAFSQRGFEEANFRLIRNTKTKQIMAGTHQLPAFFISLTFCQNSGMKMSINSRRAGSHDQAQSHPKQQQSVDQTESPLLNSGEWATINSVEDEGEPGEVNVGATEQTTGGAAEHIGFSKMFSKALNTIRDGGSAAT